MRAPFEDRGAPNPPNSFDAIYFKRSEATTLESLPRGNLLRKKAAWVLWDPIFNAAVQSIERYDWNSRVSRCMTRSLLLTWYIQKGQSMWRLVKRRFLDVLVSLLDDALGFDGPGVKQLCPPVASTRYHLNSWNCFDKLGENHVEVQVSESPRLVILFSKLEAISLLALPAS